MLHSKKTEIIEDNIQINHKQLKIYSNIIISTKYQHVIFLKLKILILKSFLLKICSYEQLYF